MASQRTRLPLSEAHRGKAESEKQDQRQFKEICFHSSSFAFFSFFL
jgi:hypothetical protein